MSEYPDADLQVPKHEIALSLANALMRLGKNDWNGARHYIELTRHDLESWLVVWQQRYKPSWRVEEHVNGNEPTGKVGYSAKRHAGPEPGNSMPTHGAARLYHYRIHLGRNPAQDQGRAYDVTRD